MAPPICAAPVEFDAVLLPLPPILSGTLAPALRPEAPTDPEGNALAELTCAVPVELLEVLPPPTCTAPTEFVAVLSPEPPIATGAETAALVPA